MILRPGKRGGTVRVSVGTVMTVTVRVVSKRSRSREEWYVTDGWAGKVSDSVNLDVSRGEKM